MPYKPLKKIKDKPFKFKPQTIDKRYNTTAWRKIRAVFLRDYPLCNICKQKESTVLDHITPVRLGGDFWNTRNYQALCKYCHNSKSAKESKILPKT
jgi:5-methylcytosine-specific restriction protein A